jgi:hypothetical protein
MQQNRQRLLIRMMHSIKQNAKKEGTIIAAIREDSACSFNSSPVLAFTNQTSRLIAFCSFLFAFPLFKLISAIIA